MNWGMVSPESVFVIAIVDRNFDGYRCVDQANDCSWDSDEVRVSAIRRASKSEGIQSVKCQISIS